MFHLCIAVTYTATVWAYDILYDIIHALNTKIIFISCVQKENT